MLSTGGALSGCDVLKLTVVNHAGPIAAAQWHLYVVVGIVLVFVAGPVLLLTPIMAWRYRLSNEHSTYKPKWDFSWWIEGLIWIPPTGIVIGLAFLLWTYTHRLDPYRPIASTQPTVEVQAVGLDWKWLFIYPDHHVAVINQLAIPVGRPIHLSLTSGTVMQSLMVPRLGGQIYAMAGMRTELNLAASQPGVFRGENTQYNGPGFPQQKFDVVALPAPDYDRWLARVRAAAHPLDTAAYAALFQRSVPAHPIYYSRTPDGFFGYIMSRFRSSPTENER
ncbi:ubiquinol oxidase subunit II [Sphingomonas oligophenolica]|uniref:Ubiquinol oxidase subunit II n=2 Tax=Sphingomonas oligophenolica TaxID=301154 RepID=A0A502CN97_9SPHN|nr:ubiquinol oxidase subunit II [Sphingomonas oligophenolica]